LPRETRRLQSADENRVPERAAEDDGRQSAAPRAAGGRLGVGRVGLVVALLAVLLHADADKYEIYAVRYATLANFPLSSLVGGADRSRRLDIAMMIWVLKGADGRVAMVDSGFHREQYFRQFTVRDYLKPSDAIAPLGLKPEEVTDLLITHMHWDHAGGIDLFPAARGWIHKD